MLPAVVVVAVGVVVVVVVVAAAVVPLRYRGRSRRIIHFAGGLLSDRSTGTKRGVLRRIVVGAVDVWCGLQQESQGERMMMMMMMSPAHVVVVVVIVSCCLPLPCCRRVP